MRYLSSIVQGEDYSFSRLKNDKTRVQALVFIFTVLLIIVLGFKIFNIERNNADYFMLFNETRDKIKLLTNQIGKIDKKITQEKGEDNQVKIELFNKLNKRVKNLERTLKQNQFNKDSNKKAKEDMTFAERIEEIQKTIWQQNVILELLQNNAKEIVRHTKDAKFDEIVKFDYFKPEKKRNPWMLERANLKTPFRNSIERKLIEDELQKEDTRLQYIYHYNKYTTELPFCIIVPSFNNAKNFRYQYNLQSIFNQDYSNYRVVIVDDNSSDNTTALIKHFLKKPDNKKLAEKVVLITNKKQMTAVPNIHMAITKHCRPNQIGFFVDGDDQLVGRKVFKVFNAIYQSKKPAVAYSISLQYWVYDNFVKDGWSAQYSDEEKQQNSYRDVPQKISHLRSFRIDLYLQIRQRDLKDVNGEWFSSTYDEVICLPMLQMSCGNIEYIDDFFYLYVYGTGYNDRLVDSTLQWSIANYVKTKMPKYQCKQKYAKQQQLI